MMERISERQNHDLP